MNKEIDLINKKFNLNYNNSNEINWEYIIKNYVLDSKFIKKYYKKFKINDLITYQDVPIKVLYELSNKIFKSTNTVKLLIQNQELTENYIKIYILPYLINFKISGNIIKK